MTEKNVSHLFKAIATKRLESETDDNDDDDYADDDFLVLFRNRKHPADNEQLDDEQ